MRIHLLGLPSHQTTKEYSADGFCSATIRFAKVLKLLNYEVILYASEENEAPCDELVTVITKEEQTTLLGDIPHQMIAMMPEGYPLWALSNKRMIAEIGKRKRPRDFICTIGGASQKEVTDAHPDLIAVEYSIGYASSYSKYRVYESNCWRGMIQGGQNMVDGRFFDATIPLFFDRSEFVYRPKEAREPFALYVGRLIVKKGLEIACRAAREANVELKVIGHGDTSLITHGATYLGQLSQDERNDWMSRASCLICPTTYVEPFGSVAVEAQMCGTPVISSDFGGFTETVEHGKTGFRCSYMGEFIRAIDACRTLDHKYIMERAHANYSLEAVAPLYDAYFKRLMLLWDKGFDSL